MIEPGERILGFNTGCLRSEFRFVGAAKKIKEIGCNAIEISLRLERLDEGWLDELKTEDLAGFDYVSLHAPRYDFDKDEKSAAILSRIKKFSAEVRKLDMVVFHPDGILDFSVLQESGLPIGVENMDQRKETHRTVEDMKKLLSDYPDFALVFDTNHAFVNDNSYKLGREFVEKLGDRIKEIHLSGFKILHDPIFETRQIEMIQTISGLDVPIIVESDVTSENIVQERQYVLDNLK